jgi:hypothetical protein
VTSPGSIDLLASREAGPSVYGNMRANNDITIGSGGLLMRVLGNVETRGSFTLNGGVIGGHVRAVENATMASTTYISNAANDGSDIMYGKTGSFSDSWVGSGLNDTIGIFAGKAATTSTPEILPNPGSLGVAPLNGDYKCSPFNTKPTVEKVISNADSINTTDPATNCDPLDITKIVNDVKGGSLYDFISGSADDIYTLTPLTMKEGSKAPFVSSSMAKVLGNNKQVLKFNNFSINADDHVTVEGGDVTIYVKSDFTISGKAKLDVKAGSSLTIIMSDGALNLSGLHMMPENFPQAYSASGLPPISIYSSYGGSGINVTGDFKLYAAIYAPNAVLDIGGSGTLYGSVRAKEIKLSGTGNIHFDTALSESGGGGSHGTQPKLKFLGINY